jgi:hypothetical protein
MRKLMALVILLIPACLLGGCAGFGRFSQNTLDIHNGSSYDIKVVVNGQALAFEFPGGRKSDRLRPGENAAIGCWRTGAFVAKALAGNEFVGVTTYRKQGAYSSSYGGQSYGQGYYDEPEVWVITDDDFRDFTFANAVRLWGQVNPRFFEGTVVAKAAAAVLAETPGRATTPVA